jgi:hypothetical protein
MHVCQLIGGCQITAEVTEHKCTTANIMQYGTSLAHGAALGTSICEGSNEDALGSMPLRCVRDSPAVNVKGRVGDAPGAAGEGVTAAQ